MHLLDEFPLSRLYYWTDRIVLEGNSETGFLLCLPLRSADGTVFGVCGIGVSDRLFKQAYSPDNEAFPHVFAAAAPAEETVLHLDRGMLAGNSYLTSARMEHPFQIQCGKEGFCLYSGEDGAFGGLHTGLKLYPSGSVYEDQAWAVSILMPEKLQLPPSGRLDARDEFGFLDEGEMTLREFCEVHGLPYPPAKEKFHLRPARPDEAGLFYAQPPGEDERLGTVGHLQMDFGRGGKEFWRIWWPSDVKEGNYPAFQTELKEVVETLRKNVLKDRFAMERFRRRHDGKISGGGTQGYGYIVETEHYRYCLRCCPSSGSSSVDLICYALDVQRQNMAQEKLPVGRVTYVGGDVQEFTDAEAFLKCLREELPFSSTTGFRYKVLANDPAIRKAVDDIAYDFWGEENPRALEDYEPQQDMTLGGM